MSHETSSDLAPLPRERYDGAQDHQCLGTLGNAANAYRCGVRDQRKTKTFERVVKWGESHFGPCYTAIGRFPLVSS